MDRGIEVSGVLGSIGFPHAGTHPTTVHLSPIPSFRPKVKIIDFGFSTIVPPGKKLKVFCGTPSYMAPEIVARPGPVGDRRGHG